MDFQNYSRALSFVVCELTMPVKRHVYKFAVNNQSSLNHHLLSAAAKAVGHSKRKRTKSHRHTVSSSNLSDTGQRFTSAHIPSEDKKPSQVKKEVEEFSQIEKVVEYMSEGLDENDPKKTDIIEVKEEQLDIAFKNDSIFVESGNHISNRTLDNTTESVHLDSNNLDVTQENILLHEEEIRTDKINTVVSNNSKGSDIICDSNSDSCDEMSSFYSDPLILCSDSAFKTMFRITRTTLQNLLEFLSIEEMELIENVPLYKKILIVLWLMGYSGSYSDAAQMFGVSEEDAANCFFDVCATLYNKCDNVIRWPSIQESNEIASRIEKKYGFPEVVGVIGCHYFSIPIPKEALARREHFNAKNKTYSIALQIVCDDRLVIRDIFPGLPGSKPAAQVLRDSPLCEQLTSRTQSPLVEPHRHLLARKEYPQLRSMLTPYTKQATVLTKEEAEFNNLHESVCQLADQTFQMLQDRFLTLRMLDPEVATMVLVSACILHNICIENGDLFGSTE